MISKKLYGIAENKGIEIHSRNMGGFVKSQSQPAPSGAHYVAVDYSRISTRAEENVVLAHEIGHCLTGAFYSRYTHPVIRARQEMRANKAALNMALPLNALMCAIDYGCNNRYEFSEYLGLTEDFVQKALDYYADDLRAAWLRRSELYY